MNIKTMDGTTENVASSGSVNTALTLGAIGLGLGVLNRNGILGGILGGNQATCSEDEKVNRYEMQMSQQMAAKDMEIAILKSSQDTDKKLVDVYTTATQRDNAMRDRLDAVEKELAEKIAFERESRLAAEKDQAVFNQSVNGSMSIVKTQIAQLQTEMGEITTSVVPSRKVCDTGCCGCN